MQKEAIDKEEGEERETKRKNEKNKNMRKKIVATVREYDQYGICLIVKSEYFVLSCELAQVCRSVLGCFHSKS